MSVSLLSCKITSLINESYHHGNFDDLRRFDAYIQFITNGNCYLKTTEKSFELEKSISSNDSEIIIYFISSIYNRIKDENLDIFVIYKNTCGNEYSIGLIGVQSMVYVDKIRIEAINYLLIENQNKSDMIDKFINLEN